MVCPPESARLQVPKAQPLSIRGAAATIQRWLPDIIVEAGDTKSFTAVAELLLNHAYTPRARYAATPTYLFSATDQDRRMRSVLVGA